MPAVCRRSIETFTTSVLSVDFRREPDLQSGSMAIVCFRATAKLTSTADIGRKAFMHGFVCESPLGAFFRFSNRKNAPTVVHTNDGR